MLQQSVGGAPVGEREEYPLAGNTPLAEDKCPHVRGIFEVPYVVEGVLEAGDLGEAVQADMTPAVSLEVVGWSKVSIEVGPTSDGESRVAWRGRYIAGGEPWAGGLVCELRLGHYGECATVPGRHAYS